MTVPFDPRPLGHRAVPSDRPPLERWRDRIGRAQPSVRTATWMIVAVTVMYSFVAYFARTLADAGLAPSSVALHRYLLTALVCARFIRVDRPSRRATSWGIASGLAMGLGWMAYAHAIAVADVTNVSIVYLSYPLFTLLGAWLLFRIVPTRRAVIGGFLIVGAALVAFPPGQGIGNGGALLVAVIAPVSFGGSIAVLTERLNSLDAFERLGAVTFGAVLGLLLPVSQQPWSAVVPPTMSAWMVTIGIGVVATLIPMFLYAIAAPSIGPARSAMTGAIELPVLFALAAIVFGESIRWSQIAAGLLIVVAIVVTPARTPPPAAVASAGGRDS